MNTDGTYNHPKKYAESCIVAPGTGLGTGILVFNKKRGMLVPVPAEAGHVDFPAST